MNPLIRSATDGGTETITGDEEITLSVRELGTAVATITDATARAYAQAGFDAAVRYYRARGQLLPDGRPVQVKSVVRDDAGRITSVIEETVTVQERRGP